MKYYGIYKITNKVNGKMYIGQHTTYNLDDGYMGSGAVMKKALKKYGKEAFTKEWLEFAENAEDLNYLETMYVDEEWLARPDTYNLALGGKVCKGWHHTEESKKKISVAAAGAGNGMYGRHHSKETRQKLADVHRNKAPWNKGKVGSQVPWNKGKPMKEESKAKLSEARRKFCEERGKTHWYHNVVTKQNAQLKESEVQDGWVRGKLFKRQQNG